MTISNLVVAAGKEIALGPDDVLEIQVSFDYTASQPADVVLWASLGIGIGRDMESFKDIHLEATTTTETWSGETQIQIPTSGKTDGTYWMKVEVDGEEVTIQSAVVISGMPTGFGFGVLGQLITLMIVMMMMNMMMNLMKDPEGFMFAAGEKVKRVREIKEEIKEILPATKRAFVEEE